MNIFVPPRIQPDVSAGYEARTRVIAIILGLYLTCTTHLSTECAAQDSTDEPDAQVTQQPADPELYFAFSRTPWRDVIVWLADEAGLALHVGDLPTGTFSYSDPRSYTTEEAISRLNLFLLPEGFTLVRSGKLLSVVDLNDARSARQLDTLARLVQPSELAGLNDYDLVKCILPLGELNPEDAIEELAPLNLIMTPAVFNRTKQLLIVDTAAKLKSARTILDKFAPDELNNGTIVRNFQLEHADAEDILMVARPHLGLATGEMIGIDVSLSSDPLGKSLFVTGVADKVKLVENLVEAIDVADVDEEASQNRILKAHPVDGGDVDLVYDVLLTLLADRNVRLSMDQNAGTVVALATPDVHESIATTIEELAADEVDFAVIPLKNVDPFFAVSLIEQMLDLDSLSQPLPFERSSGNSRSRDDGRNQTRQAAQPEEPPRIDADPGNKRLFVRGKPHQIDQIRKIVEEIDKGNSTALASGDTVRLMPHGNWDTNEVLRAAARFWTAGNPVLTFPSTSLRRDSQTERVVSEPSRTPVPSAIAPGATTSAKLLTGQQRTDKPPILCQVVSRGLMLQCDDPEALDQFHQLLLDITGDGDSSPSEPVVFYLKYTKAEDAARMLAELLDGQEAAKEAEADTLVNGYVSGSDTSFLGSLLTSREGTITMMAGTMTVVADPRLNRLIAQGTTSDIQTIERYLKIVDKDNSLTSIETYGISQVIELQYSRAAEVADTIRTAYAGRVTAAPATGQPGTQPSQGRTQPSTEKKDDKDKSKDSRQPQKSSSQSRDLEPRMTVAVHEPSNSLVVTAPRQLFEEVQELARMIDERNRKSVRIMNLPGGVAVEDLQNALFGGSTATGLSRGTGARLSSSSTSNSNTSGKPANGK